MNQPVDAITRRERIHYLGTVLLLILFLPDTIWMFLSGHTLDGVVLLPLTVVALVLVTIIHRRWMGEQDG